MHINKAVIRIAGSSFCLFPSVLPVHMLCNSQSSTIHLVLESITVMTHEKQI